MNRPSRSSLAIALAASGGFAAICPADFIGYVFDTYVVNVSGVDHFVCDIYGQFDDPLDTVTSVFNANIATVTGTAFHHNDFETLAGGPGTWGIWATANLPQLGLVPTNDSFVMIGGPFSPGATNTTSLEGVFDPPTAPMPPANCGWFNAEPSNLQGRVAPATLRTQIGRFVLESFSSGPIMTFAANLAYDQGPGTDIRYAWDGGQGSGPTTTIALIPTPAAATVLLALSIGARRDRRRGRN